MIKSFAGRSIAAATAVLFALALTMQPSNAGLGLGEARVNSFLGQGLDVRIVLLQPSPEALDTLTVEIASPEDHARLGVPADALALGLRVELDRSVDPPVLQLRSTRPVSEPFLQLLISARWASGRMLREYTLFLDPPTVAVAPPVRRLDPVAPVAVAPEREVTEREVAERRPEPVAAEPAAPAPSPAERPQPATATSPPHATAPLERVGPVRSGQTLWSIAEAWRPDPALSMNQIMLAIFEQNPQAFMGNNVNRLRQGVELVMPDVESVRAIRPDEALRRMREQNEAWRAGRPAAAAPPVVAAAVTEIEQPSPAEAEPEPEASAEVPAETPETAAPGDATDSEPATSAPAPESEPTEQVLPDAPRLELTTADEALMVDTQAIGVERDRLAGQLDGLVRELRGDGIESAEIAADIDQIRQAIDSADAGGLMVASEGLAQLEQQVRELRLERERAATEAEAVVAPMPAAPAPVTAERSGWLQPLLVAVAVLVVAVLALVLLMRRRSRRQEQQSARAATPVSAVVPAAQRPATETLDDQLKGLYRMAEREDREGFGSALNAFHAELKTTDDPRWKEAVVLARALVPGHPLLLNRTEDEAAGSSPGSDEDANRELMELLDDADLRDSGETPGSAPGAEETTDFADLFEEQEADEDNADLARLANRLDPDDDRDRIALGELEADALFTPKEPPKPAWEQESDEDPLDLDFEFSSREDAEDAAGEEGGAESGEEHGERSPGESELSSETGPVGTGAEDQDWFKLDPSADEALPAGKAEEQDGPDGQKDKLSDDDVEVKLDLARAYLSMNDADSARALLEEIVAEGTESHREQARKLLDDLK